MLIHKKQRKDTFKLSVEYLKKYSSTVQRLYRCFALLHSIIFTFVSTVIACHLLVVPTTSLLLFPLLTYIMGLKIVSSIQSYAVKYTKDRPIIEDARTLTERMPVT